MRFPLILIYKLNTHTLLQLCVEKSGKGFDWINTVDSCDCWYCVLFCFPASIYQENRFNGIDSESSTVYWEIKKGNRNICGQFRLILFICLALLEPPRSPLCHLAFHLTTDLLRFERTGQIPEIGRLVQTHSLCISATHRRDEKSPSWHSQGFLCETSWIIWALHT